MQSKRGCVFGCIFCPSRSIWGCSFRLRSPKKVADEIEMLVNDFGITSFSFAESVFNSPIDYSRKLCQEIINRKLDVKWAAAFNPAFINSEFYAGSSQSRLRVVQLFLLMGLQIILCGFWARILI